jgi:hypothetical protein
MAWIWLVTGLLGTGLMREKKPAYFFFSGIELYSQNRNTNYISLREERLIQSDCESFSVQGNLI